MMILIIGLSSLLFGLGFLITESNAHYLLSGYNTLSDTDKENFDLKSFLSFNKKFHILLGLSTLIIGFIIYNKSPDNSILFIGIYPILAYSYFIWESLKYYKKQNKTIALLCIVVLIGTALLVSFIFLKGMKPTEIRISKTELIFTGSYGESIPANQIKDINLINDLPQIKFKSNGFSTNQFKKGYFKTASGEKVKLLLSNAKPPYLEITKGNDQRIFYQTKQQASDSLLQSIITQLNLSNQ